MISNERIYSTLREAGIDFFCGVPDSLLKNFCAYLSDHSSDKEHIITANEGAAIALASGYHIATGKLPLVYLQNSGLGNTINPLLSLADTEVYGIPMLVMIGWRGEPGIADEPQHRKQGRIQNSLLESMEIPFEILGAETENPEELIKTATHQANSNQAPVAIVVRKNTFEPYHLKSSSSEVSSDMSREKAIQIILEKLGDQDVVISTTGKPSREVFEYRAEKKFGHQNDFLTVGSMGHCSQIALGVALHTNHNVYCLDGDGALIMHMGGLSIIGQSGAENFRHIVLNNGAHDSVGGQPTVAMDISIPKIAQANGYKEAFRAESEEELIQVIDEFIARKGPVLLEVVVKKGARKDLGRPTTTPTENKEALMKFLKSANYEAD